MELSKVEIKKLENEASRIRHKLIEVVGSNGGHLASNLGVVELTMTLHKIFNFPKDKLLFDVGHQTYVHKILTKREDKISTIRQYNGLSPFMDPNESEYDPFITGHAGSAISASCGIAIANPENKIICVVGDASISNGHSLEALNNIEDKIKNIIIILNDNEMSIDKNVGSLSKFFSKLMYTKIYVNIKDEITNILHRIKKDNSVYKLLKRIEEAIKIFFNPLSVAEVFGFKYFRIENGHSFEELFKTIRKAKRMEGPIFIHVKTHKGKGYRPAEENQEKFHGISPFNIKTGIYPIKQKNYSDLIGEKLFELMAIDKNIIAITAAMVNGTGLKKVFKSYPNQTYDVGMSEGHAVTFAGGLAKYGKKPYVAIYSTFMQRAYDQLIHDVALQNLPVRFIIDRAGIVGEDGKTHQGLYDISYFSNIGNYDIIAPTTSKELIEILEFSAQKIKNPLVIRLPRTSCFDLQKDSKLRYGKWKKIQKVYINDFDKDTQEENLFIVTGSMLEEILNITADLKQREINGDIISAAFINPMDIEFLKNELKKYKNIFVLEEGFYKGGFGSKIIEWCNENLVPIKINKIAIMKNEIFHGKRNEILRNEGLTGISLVERIESFL